jgi:type I restriction enzyme M protein
MANFQEKADFIWGLADMLRGDYLRREYPDVILPMVVIRRLDLAMAATREEVRQAYEKYKGKLENLHGVLTSAAKDSLVYNTSEYHWDRLLEDPNNLAQNLINYLNGFSPDVQDIIEKFDFRRQVSRLQSINLLLLLFRRFDRIRFLDPGETDNHEMGSIFEHLIYRFNQDNNETAGEHFTPREVIRLMVRLLLLEDEEALTNPNAIITIYDPACGTGGMLTEAKNYISQRNQDARVELFGQEINPTAYAVAKSDFLLKGEDPRKLILVIALVKMGMKSAAFAICFLIRLLGWTGARWSTSLGESRKRKGLMGGLVQACPELMMGRCCFFSTC